MKALRSLFAVIWLMFGLTTLPVAVPTAETPCHSETTNDGVQKKPLTLAMTCCSQPISPHRAGDDTLASHLSTSVQHKLAPSPLPRGIRPATELRPPQSV